MVTYRDRFIEWVEEEDYSSEWEEDTGALTKCSLYPVELYMNLSRELAAHDYTYGTKEQMEWAIIYLSEQPRLLQNPDQFADAHWLQKTSSLDPADRVVSYAPVF